MQTFSDELMRLRTAATPGPWECHDRGTNGTYHAALSYYYKDTDPQRGYMEMQDVAYIDLAGERCYGMWNNAAYICAACNAVPELVARIRELEAKQVEGG